MSNLRTRLNKIKQRIEHTFDRPIKIDTMRDVNSLINWLHQLGYEDEIIHDKILRGKIQIVINGNKIIVADKINGYIKDLSRDGDVEKNPGPLSKNNNKRNTTTNKIKNSTTKVVSAPAAKAKIDKLSKPKFSMPKQPGDGRVCVRHKEYIADILGSVNFASVEYNINPGLVATFPWLGTMAVAYETYRFKRLAFTFESSKSTATNGSIMLTVDFDPNDDPPTTKAQALAYNNAIRGPVWETFTYVCSPADLSKLNQKFLRYGALVTGQDLLLYDVGNLFVCTSGLADTSVIGELHVDFEVELFTPQFDLSAYALSTSAKILSSAGVSNTAWLGTTTVTTGGLGPIVSPAGTTLTIPTSGHYLINYTLDGSTLVQAGLPTFTSVGNTLAGVVATVSATRISYLFAIRIDVPTSGITVSGLTTSGTITGAATRISYYGVGLA
jgi:hypothetical protein